MELSQSRCVLPSFKLMLCRHWKKPLEKPRWGGHIQFHAKRCFGIPTILKESYSVLEINEGCSENDLREAYLRKVKEYHPDKSASEKNAEKFNQVQEAYQVALEHQKGKTDTLEDLVAAEADVYDYDIQHTVPQHRRYLTFEGIGSGSPSQRQRQYKQFRVHQASENVYEHRKMKFCGDESAVAVKLKDQEQARKIKISNFIHRVVDDLIRESMQKGDFENLPGKGKPLDYSNHNPLVDTTTHNINKILVNNGFKPEWIMLSKEIRDDICDTRQQLAVIREQLGPPPYSEPNEMRWKFHIDKFNESISEINNKINRFNNVVPLMEKQMVHYDALKNMRRVLEDHCKHLPTNEEGRQIEVSQLPPITSTSTDDRINWGEVWTNIKELFRPR